MISQWRNVMKTRFALSAFLLALPLSVLAQTKTTGYTYDALGRLTYVADSANGNRDYDYDKAGNRVNVAINTASDGASEAAAFTFPAPIVQTPSLIANCAWRASWSAVPNATQYYVTDTSGGSLNGGNTYYTTTYADIGCPSNNSSANKPKSVQACNANKVCGTKALFPQ
jgi:YD repeat-containing protein